MPKPAFAGSHSGKDNRLDGIDIDFLQTAHFVLGNTPDIVGNEVNCPIQEGFQPLDARFIFLFVCHVGKDSKISPTTEKQIACNLPFPRQYFRLSAMLKSK